MRVRLGRAGRKVLVRHDHTQRKASVSNAPRWDFCSAPYLVRYGNCREDRILRALEEQYNARRAAVTEAIVETIRSIGQNPSVRQISKNCFTIRFSDLIGAPWSPSFHDWHRQAELLIGVLLKKPVLRWGELIRQWADRPGKKRLPGHRRREDFFLTENFFAEVVARL